jgi:hypothetical protein
MHQPFFQNLFDPNNEDTFLSVRKYWFPPPKFSADIIREVIRWVYLHTLNPKVLKECSKEILEAATEFKMPSLAREAEMELLRQLNRENVLETISIADFYNVRAI